MTELLSPSPSPYAYLDALPPSERLAARRLQEHRRNAESGSVIDTARRARDLQAELSDIEEELRAFQQDYVELEQLADARCTEKEFVEEERDALRTMCAELIEVLKLTREFVADVPIIGDDCLAKADATLTRARKLLGGGE